MINLVFFNDIERIARYSRQAQVDAEAGLWAEAAPRYARAASLDRQAFTAFNAGAAFLQSGDFDNAQYWFDEALRRDPAHLPSQQGRQQVDQFRVSK